eukprot:TRINITY_DN95206_c0_g1_i1.p1 TRINITY_DN95206_c0_g1~~TRINITY_DN95206_c0_g1_i1.p1  ORF type:complete len:193 (-),score=52.94 TRINITY_DN95206_c0_g1_i1:50-628(-)
MGGGPSQQKVLECYPDSDSPSGDGTQCVLSDPLDKYFKMEDDLWERLVKWRRQPIKDFYALTVEVWDDPDGTLCCKKVFSGQLMPPWLKKQGSSPVRIFKTTFEKQTFTMRRSVYLGDGVTVAWPHDVVRIHEDPMLLEVYRITTRGARSCGLALQDAVSKILNMIVTGSEEPLPDLELADAKEAELEEQQK